MGKQYVCGSCGRSGHNKRFHTQQNNNTKKVTPNNVKSIDSAKTKKTSERTKNKSSLTTPTTSNVKSAYAKFANVTVEEENVETFTDYDFDEVFPSNHNTVSDSELEEIYQSGKAETSYDLNSYREHEDKMRRLNYVRTKVTFYTDQYLDGRMSRTEHYRKVENLATTHGFLLEEVYDA